MSNQTSPTIHTRLKDIVDPSHTALVVWDVQNLLVKGVFKPQAFFKNSKLLLDKTRKSRIPVILQ